MLDRLVELLGTIWEHLVPCVIVMDYQSGVHLRLGKYKRTLEPGFYWKIPFADSVLVEHTAITTIALPPQSLTTKDGKAIVVKGMVKYRIADVRAYCLQVWDAPDVLVDTSCGIIRETVNEKQWDEIREGKIDGLISRRVTAAVKSYGIQALWVTLTDNAEMKSMRLFVGKELNTN